MLMQEGETIIPNPKINKTFTPRREIGNLQKILQLRQPLLERWITILTNIYDLSEAIRNQLATEVTDPSILEELLGVDWQKKLTIKNMTPYNMMLTEVQFGIKCGEDCYKTDVPFPLLMNRARDYEQAIRKWHPQTVDYTKGVKRQFEQALSEGHSPFQEFLSRKLSGRKNPNIVGKMLHASMRFFQDKTQKNIVDCISSDEDCYGVSSCKSLLRKH